MALHIENVHPDEQQTVISLLEQGQLPTDDLPLGLPGFVIAKDDEIAVGVAGLENFGSVGLLRSVAVNPAYQGQGIAAQLFRQLLTTAQTAELKEIYLITTTADDYFTRHGFAPVDRALVPSAIQQTQQFSGLCPSTAIVMKRAVQQEEV